MKIKNTDFLFAENPNPMWIFDPADLTIHQVNDAACDLYGYSEQEFLELTIADLRPEEEIPKLMEEVSKGINAFSNAGIWKHRKKNGELLFVRILSYPITREGKKFELIAAHDVTNKIEYREELHRVLENSLDGIMLTSPDGRIHRVNKAACQILGMSEEQIKNLGRDGIVLNDEKLQKALSKRSKTGDFSGELTLIHSSGRKIPVDMTTSVYTDPQGQLRTSIIFRDITQRKQTEQQLQESLERYRRLFENMNTGFVLFEVVQDEQGIPIDLIILAANDEFEKTTGLNLKNAVGKHLTEVLPGIEIDEADWIGTYSKVALSGEPIQFEQDSELLGYYYNVSAFKAGPKQCAVTFMDITESKRVEEKLQESLERYRYATKATSDAIYEWDIVNNQLYLGEGFKDIFGYDVDKQSISLEEYTHFVHPDDHPNVQKSLDKTLTDPSLNYWNNQYRFKKADGQYAQAVESGYIIRNDEGIAIRMIGAIRDVTKQRELERLLDEAYTIGGIGVWEVNLKSNNLYWSPVTKELHEVEPDFEPELETAINFYKEGKSRATIQKVVNNAIEEGIPWDVELQIVTAKGNERWVRSKGEPEIVDGQCHRVYGIFQDVHERKEAQTKMIEALEERQRILERINEAFFALDEESTVIFWNSKAEKISGLSRTEVLGKNLWDVFSEAKELDFFHQYKRATEQQTPVSFEEYYPPLNAWLEVHAYPSSDGLSVFFRDITDRKQNQIELERANKEKETILESIGDGFFSVDRNWIVTYWNKAAERLLQIPRHAILGDNLWDVFEGATDLPSYTHHHRVMHQGTPAHFEDYYAATDRWLDVNSYPSENGITVYFKDITDQKKKDIQLQETLKEKETLLAEIHHRVKNNLAVVSGMIQLQAFQEADNTLKHKLNGSVSRIKTIANIHEILYKSNSFSRLNLDENIKRLVGEIAQTYQLPIEPKIKFDLQKIDLNINQAIPASLIVNEVVTNVFKHAFDDKDQGKIWVKMTETNDTVSLQITDNGKGLPADFIKAENTSSLGLQLIDILTQQLEGGNEFESADGKTRFRLIFEKKESKGSGSAFLK